MVGGLLVLVVLAVIQLTLTLHVRNTLLDAASEGARHAALADRELADGARRTVELIDATVGSAYSAEVTASTGAWAGHPIAVVSVRAPLPVIGLIGIDGMLEVEGRAAIERHD